MEKIFIQTYGNYRIGSPVVVTLGKLQFGARIFAFINRASHQNPTAAPDVHVVNWTNDFQITVPISDISPNLSFPDKAT